MRSLVPTQSSALSPETSMPETLTQQLTAVGELYDRAYAYIAEHY